MDTISRRILALLTEDAGATLSEIAKDAKVSKETAAYRIKQMLKKRVIKKFVPVFNPVAAGYSEYVVSIKFQKLSPGAPGKIIEYLKGREEVSEIRALEGDYDFRVCILVKTIKEAGDFLSGFKKEFGAELSRNTLAAIMEKHIFSPWRITGYRTRRKKLSFYEGNERADLSDVKIISALCSKEKPKTIEIARRSGLSPRTVQDRIKKMEKRGVLEGQKVVLNEAAFSASAFQVGILLQDTNYIKKMGNFFEATGRCAGFEVMIGEYDLEAVLWVSEPEHVDEIMQEFGKKFFDKYLYFETSRIRGVEEQGCFGEQ